MMKIQSCGHSDSRLRRLKVIAVIAGFCAFGWTASSSAVAKEHSGLPDPNGVVARTTSIPTIDRVQLGMSKANVKLLYGTPWVVFESKESMRVELPGTSFSREYFFGSQNKVRRVLSTGFALRLRDTGEALNWQSSSDDTRRVLGNPEEVVGQQWFYRKWGLLVKFGHSRNLNTVELNEEYRAR